MTNNYKILFGNNDWIKRIWEWADEFELSEGKIFCNEVSVNFK